MANVNTTVIIEVSGHGTFTLGKHGAAADSIHTPHVTSVTGSLHERRGSVIASSSALLYEAASSDSGDLPATWNKLFFWCDVACHLQLIELGTPTNVIFNIDANDPFILSGGALLAAASNSVITNTTTTLVAIDKIVIGTLLAANYHFFLVD